jgi:DNA (cytosine-5)-methyltransferase 1
MRMDNAVAMLATAKDCGQPCAPSVAKFSIGTDCAGLHGMWLALENLGLSSYATDGFWSEWDPSAKAVLEHNFRTRNSYTDMTKRDHSKLPKVTLYSAGFPCTCYSTEGKGEGLLSSAGSVGLHCILTVEASRPKAFFFENTKNLTSKKHEKDFHLIMQALAAIKDAQGHPAYTLYVRVMNTLKQGIPQNRERTYIVGILNKSQRRKFRWPSDVPMMPLDYFLIGDACDPPELPTSMTEQKNYLSSVKEMFSKGMSLTADVVADLGGGFARKNGDSHHLVVGYSPCLTKTRCKSASYYLFSKQRKMQLAEMYKLQGIPVGRVRKPKTVSESQMRGMLGNTFTVPVVARIVDRILYAVGTTSELQCRGYDVDVEAAIWTGPPPAQKLPAKRGSKTGQSQGSGAPPLKNAKRA